MAEKPEPKEGQNVEPSPTPSPPVSPPKAESKKQEKKAEAKPIYPKYPGWSCPVCGSKRVTNNDGKYICPVSPKPSDCPVN